MIFLKSKSVFQSFIKLHNRVTFSTAVESSKEKWDIITAVCLERKPVIIPEMNKIERDYHEYLADLELTNSLKNDFELRNEAEIKQLELLKSGGEDFDSDVTLKQTAQDFIDACTEEAAKIKLASQITDDDKKNNVMSLNRKLDKHLVLLVNQKVGDKSLYLLPQGVRKEGETLRQAAERILKEKCGEDIKGQIYGNAPAGFHKYKYPKSARENGIRGAKIFIYFARYLRGQVQSKKSDFKWMDRKELYKTLPSEYGKSVEQLLMDE